MAAVRNSQTPVGRPGVDTTHCAGPDRPAGEAASVARILVVGDEPLVTESVPACLRFAGYEAGVARSGAEAVTLSQRLRPDLVVLDLRLPDADGLTLARGIRRWHRQASMLFLAPADQPLDRGAGLTVGGDDYLLKPFSLDEFTARVRAGLRRAGATDRRDAAVLRFADLELDEDTQVVRRGGQPVRLAPREREILRYLLINTGRIMTRAHIHEHVWPYGHVANPRTLDVHICTLRRKLDRYGRPLIQTMHGVGYTLRQPEGGVQLTR